MFLFLGLGPGAVYAALGLGLVVMYRGSGVLNLAYGAMAMYPAYVYASLRTSGDLVLPGIPGTHHLGSAVSTVPAVIVATLVGGVLGLVAYALVFRPLRSASPLANMVAAVGILIALQSVVTLRFGGDPRLIEPLLPAHRWHFASTNLPADRAYLVVLVAVVAAGAWVVYRMTRFGLASRAAVENFVATELLGISTVRLGALNWAAGGVVAGLFGILLAPIAGLTPNGYALLVIPALVAAIAGRLVSITATVAGGLALGVVQSEATLVHLPWNWATPETVKEVIPFVVLVAVLLALGTALPQRGSERGIRLPPAPEAGRRVRFVMVTLATGSVATLMLGGPWQNALVVSFIGMILCSSVVILTGFAGQVSLAQMSFSGIGALMLSRMASDWHIPFPLGLLLAATTAAGAAALLGLVTSRSRGAVVAIVSLGAALTVEELIFRHLSRGLFATNVIDPPRPFGVSLAPIGSDGRPRAVFGVFVVAVAAAAIAGVLSVRSGGFGRRMLAVRANERAAAAAGVNVTRVKIGAFALAGFLAGLGGTLLGYHQRGISAQSFAVSRSLLVLAVTTIGGVASVSGAVVGGLVIPGGIVATAADRVLHLGEYTSAFLGTVVTVLAVRRAGSRARTEARP